MAKILLWGDGGCTTGFGRVTNELCTRFVENGHEVHVLGINFRGELTPPFDKVPYRIHIPTKHDPTDFYGYSRLVELIVTLEPDIFIMFNDIPIIAECVEQLNRLNSRPATVIYTPIDCINLPPSWGKTLSLSNSFITYTEFAKAELRKISPRPIEVAYHGMDHADFYPVSRENPSPVRLFTGDLLPAYSKQEIKAANGMAEDSFVILFADRNSPRKNLPGFFSAVAPFMHRHPDANIWIHAKLTDQGGDVRDFVDRFGLKERVWITPDLDSFNGISDAELNTLYNLADIKISTSLGEGAGLTNMESIMAGTPVIAQDFSATREMLGDGALYAQVGYIWTTPRGTDSAFPVLEDYDTHLEEFYHNHSLREQLIRDGREYMGRFKWDDAVSVFEDEFKRILGSKY